MRTETDSLVVAPKAAASLDSTAESIAGNTEENGADTVAKPPGRTSQGRFAPGNTGRPQGARNKATQLAESILAGDAEAIMRVVVKNAVLGNPAAFKQCLDRFVPRPRERTVSVDLPVVETVDDAARAAGQLTALVGSGELTPREAKSLADVVEAQRRILAVRDYDRRINDLEESVEALRALLNEVLASEIVVPPAPAGTRDEAAR